MKITAEPRSDQWNADDFISSHHDFIIDHVDHGTAEQKYDIHFVGEKRVWRPPLTVLRLLMKAWGDDGKEWAGHAVRLYRDDTVSFGRDRVGGIRVSHASHLPDGKALTVQLTESRGKRARHTLEPMPVPGPAAPEPTAEEVAACTDRDELRDMYRRSSPERQEQIKARVADLDNEPTP